MSQDKPELHLLRETMPDGRVKVTALRLVPKLEDGRFTLGVEVAESWIEGERSGNMRTNTTPRG